MARRTNRSLKRGDQPNTVRIVGGHHGGRRLKYSGDPKVRPMKDRTREAVFNLLGPFRRTELAYDLFAGTGAMGLEAISRGAAFATFLERHAPTARVIDENIATLDVGDQTEVFVTDSFRWARSNPEPTDAPWVVFCCPPYRLYHERWEDLSSMLDRFIEQAPSESIIVVEADQEFDADQLPNIEQWRVRDYAPARIAILNIE